MLRELGCAVEENVPDCTGADEAFKAWRAWYYELAFGDLLEEHHDELKDTVVQEMKRASVSAVRGSRRPSARGPRSTTAGVEGVPMGTYIDGILQLAHAFEQATGFWKRRPWRER